MGERDQNPPFQTLHISTLNTRSLLSTERLLELKEAVSNINYDVIGLSEVRRTGYAIIDESDQIFCFYGETKGLHGVGFLIRKYLKENIESFIGVTERICVLNLKFDNTLLSIVQAYAPTSDASDQVIENFYHKLQEIKEKYTKNLIIMGDFNARIGQRLPSEKHIMGPYCYGKRDKRGERLLQFAIENNLTIVNSIFKKKTKNLWTWLSPKKNKSQIDYILTNIRKNFSNIDIIKQFTFCSDHRMIRSTIHLAKSKKRRSTFNNMRIKIDTSQNQLKYLEALKYSLEKSNISEKDDIELYYSKFKIAIVRSLNTIKTINKKNNYISNTTKSMMQRRSELQHKKPLTLEEKNELRKLYKNISKQIKREYNEHKLHIIKKHLNTSRSLKKGLKETYTARNWIPCLSRNSTKSFSRLEIINIATEFYRSLYAQKTHRLSLNSPTFTVHHQNSVLDGIAVKRFTEQEILSKIQNLTTNKSSGPDNIPTEAFKTAKHLLVTYITILFNKILDNRKIPKEWAQSDIILLYKKGDPADINNYRPISLQPIIYKLFASCLENHLEPYIENYQPNEQAGFRKKFSTIDHIHSLELIIEKYEEQQSPLYLAFIDYAKAFDSISHESIWKALEDCKVPNETIEVLKDIYQKSISRVKLESKGPEIKIERGVRQGDPLSPKLFITVLEYIMKNLKWTRKGIFINGKYLNNLRFADDIVIFSETPAQLEIMINDLNNISRSIGLELNTTKTKVMTNRVEQRIEVDGDPLEYVREYIYLGKQISFKKTRHSDELNRRINLTWKKFWSYKEILKSNLPINLKSVVLDSSLLPCLSYACQTWIYNVRTERKIQTCQRAMERSILNLKRIDKQRNIEIRKRTKVIDALSHCKRLKWKWAGHVARMCMDRWSKKVTHWSGPNGKRKQGRPPDRWLDEVKKITGNQWASKAMDRKLWSEMEEAFTL